MAKNKKILITGDGAFIGTSLAERLVDRNNVVLRDRNFDQNSFAFSDLRGKKNVGLANVDVFDMQQAERLIQDAQIVVFPNSRTHGRNFFAEAREVRDLFVRCGLFPVLYATSRTFAGKVIAKVYYGLRDCYRMVRKESRFSSGNEFHETRYLCDPEYDPLCPHRSITCYPGILPLASRVSLYRLEPLENTTRIEGREICVLATKQQTIRD